MQSRIIARICRDISRLEITWQHHIGFLRQFVKTTVPFPFISVAFCFNSSVLYFVTESCCYVLSRLTLVVSIVFQKLDQLCHCMGFY